jgi:hypothetical protein
MNLINWCSSFTVLSRHPGERACEGIAQNARMAFATHAGLASESGICADEGVPGREIAVMLGMF